MKKIITVLIISIVGLSSHARVMGKDRGGGNAALAEFVQILDISLNLLSENADKNIPLSNSEITKYQKSIDTINLTLPDDWSELSYFEKVNFSLEYLLIHNRIDPRMAKTNALLWAIHIEEVTARVLEKTFTCSRLTKMKDADGSEIYEKISISVPPAIADKLRSRQGLSKSTTTQVSFNFMGLESFSFHRLIIESPHQYIVFVSNEEGAPSEMKISINGSEISGEYILRHNDRVIMHNPLVNCHWY